MDRNRMKRVIAVMLTIAMLLCENGEQAWIMAASVDTKSNTESVFENTESDSAAVSDESENKSVSGTEDPSDTKSEDTNNSVETNTDESEAEKTQENEAKNDTTATNSGARSSESIIALPVNDDGTLGTISQGILYLINDYKGWIALANYSKEHDLSGYHFGYDLMNGNSETYDFTSTDADDFKGIGSPEHPFAGELKSTYTSNTITLKLNQPLFTCLSSKAAISNIKITSSEESSAGLAEVLKVEDDGRQVSYTDITIGGSVGYNNLKSRAGGMFAQIQYSTGNELKIRGTNVSVSASVQGQTAGGLIGELQGKGSTEIFLDGFQFSESQVKGITENDFSSGEGCVGGLIGNVKGTTEDAKLTLSTTGGSAYTYQRSAYTCSGNSRYCGGFFGRVNNMDIDVKCPMTYVGNMSNDGIMGYDAGAFAGCIEQSTVTLYRQVICQDVRLDHPKEYPSGYDWTGYGIGLFSGNLIGSKVCVADTYQQSDSSVEAEPAVLIKTAEIEDNNGSDIADKTPNCNNTGTSNAYNLGCLIGRVENSDLLFSEKHPCTIKSNKLDYCQGNMGGAVGYFSASEGTHQIEQVIFAEKNLANLMNRRSGYTGGLVGQIYLSRAGNVQVKDCAFNGKLRFASSEITSDGSVGILVGGVLSDSAASGKIIFDSDSAHNFDIWAIDSNQLYAFGGAIGKMDANFEIRDTTISSSTSGLNFTGSNINIKPDYFGGLIGAVQNTSTGTRKGVITSSDGKSVKVCASLSGGKISKAYGGLFGYVGQNTAISLSGTITEEGQKAYLYNRKYPSYAGSIVGEQENSLVYMEPEIKFTPYEQNSLDEVGNYGGVIRNDYWDKTSEENKGELLIQNYQVSGTLSETINSTGDLLRLGIAMNTQGQFLPVRNTSQESASLTNLDQIRCATYTLPLASYDLTNTGLSCLSRNDDTGTKDTPFKGSLKGTNSSKSVLKYTVTSHNQPNCGLFASVDGGETGISFENLDVQYSIAFAQQKFAGGNNDTSKSCQKEYAGGLASVATGNITVSKVSASGNLSDVSNSDWDNNNKVFGRYNKDTNKYDSKSDDYLGGIFGKYTGTNNGTLTIDQFSCNTNLTYQDYTHVMGGVIGYVDLDQLETGESCAIQITGTETEPVSLSGQINAQNLYTNTNGSTFPIRTGGLIAQIGKTRSAYYKAKCNLTIQNLKVDGLKVSESSVSSDSEIGGLLGWNWVDVNVELANGKIGETTDTGLSVNAPFGGLIYSVSGKMVIDQLSIGSNVTIDANSADGVDQCGLLVRDGQYLYLDLRDITGTSQVNPSNYNGTDYDELVGFTKGGDDSDHGGIVSIGRKEDKYYLGRNSSTYESFKSSHIQNTNTRYYYDLNKLSWVDSKNASKNVDIKILNSADAMMRWHLLHYANAYLRGVMDADYASDKSPLPDSYQISGGTIDMTGYSFYPTPVKNETYTADSGAVIQLNARALKEEESALALEKKKYPETSSCEHYQMHAGIFGNVSGLTVTGLTLTGSFSVQTSSSQTTAGALVAGSIYGIENGTDANGKTLYQDITNTFHNIVLKDLWCVSSQASLRYEAPIGLMIADVSSGAKVKMDGISMSGYTDAEVEAGNKAASALIGNVGGENATYISLSFKNMDIADAAEGKSNDALKSSKMDEALAMASFIYSYNFAENCSGIYTFTYEDYLYGRCTTDAGKNNVVTLGQELGSNGGSPNYAQEEYYDKDYFVGYLESGDDAHKITFDCGNYLPYVYSTVKKILVNPKTGHLNEGCGTYEDPYVISTTRQLITLYRYLYEEDKFSEILANGKWSVNPVGDDAKCCDKTSNATSGHGEAIVYTGSNKDQFPSQEKLSQAYYQITANLDLSSYPEFTGFGRTDLPFTGVFVGKQIPETDPTCPTITMPDFPASSEMSNYGWIQSAKGCVVKDLVIAFPNPVTINQQVTRENAQGTEETVDEGGVGGGVIATVLGGENVIDHVTVTGKSDDISCFTPKNKKAMIGGYVGIVNAGGVLLRNMAEARLSNFTVNISTGTYDQYPYVCGIIGRVYNGYVVYDGGTDTITPLFKNLSAMYSSTSSLEQSRSYDIINGAYLINNAGSDPITWNASNGYGNIANAVHLQVLSMGLNAGLLNYGQTGLDSLYVGYNAKSRQRSGDYQYVGQVSNSDDSIEARNNVIMYDNENGATDTCAPKYHSYLSQFFKWEDMIQSNGSSQDLNPYSSVTTFQLSGSTYDLSVFGTAFRGLGARYFEQEDTRADVFHGNLTGPDTIAKITLDMQVDDIHKDTVQDVADAAFLNNVIRPSDKTQTITIKNIILTGKVCNQSRDDEIASNGVGTKNAAALISTLKYVNVTFDNVTLNTMQVASQRYAGGFIACNNNPSGKTYCVSFINCNIKGTDDLNSTKITGFADAGGLIGYSTGIVQVNVGSDSTGTSSFKSELNDLDVENNSDPASNGTLLSDTVSKNTGGLIGTILADFTIQNIQGTHITVKTTGDKQNVQIGGMIGRAGKPNENSYNYSFQNISLKNLTVENTFDNGKNSYNGSNDDRKYIIATAGIIGTVGGKLILINIVVGSDVNSDKVIIQNDGDKVPTHNAFCTAGFVGRHLKGGQITATDCHILGTNNGGQYTTLIRGQGSSTAGLFGNSYTIEGTNLSVEGVNIDASRFAGGIVGWGESDSTCTFRQISVKNSSIKYASETSLGDAGGIEGHASGKLNLYGVTVDSVDIEAKCGSMGGFIGYSGLNNEINISTYTDTKNNTYTNTVSNCFIKGSKVGGVIGWADIRNITVDNYYNDITITYNKLISTKGKTLINWGNSTETNGYAGGFAGKINSSDTRSHLKAENLKIQNNFIACYDSGKANTELGAGGVCGYMNSESVFYHVSLKDNAIGIMNANNELPDFKTTPIRGNGKGLRDSLYYVADQAANGKLNLVKQTGTIVPEKDFYQYSYLEGAVLGQVVGTDNRRAEFIDVHISYTDADERPVSDVGAAHNAKLQSNNDMYSNYRKQCTLLYDGRMTDVETETISTKFGITGTSDFNTDVPYVFGNIEEIMSAYTDTSDTADRRKAYRLDDNYQGRVDISSGENNQNLKTQNVFANTYKDNTGYKSPYKVGDTRLPMIVFRSSENGTLDQVLQTYINILTNNSGGLNSYLNQHKDTNLATILSVTSYAMKLEDGSITVNSDAAPSVTVTSSPSNGTGKGNTTYSFSSTVGDELTSETSGTFTLIRIEYGWNYSGKDDRTVHWTLDIPVYIEKRLQVYSNMKMLEGIEYNIQKIKTNGKNELSSTIDNKTSMILSQGSSYSIYAEYIYVDSEKFSSVKISKTLCIESAGNTYFSPGTKLTLIPLDEGGKAYYYAVPDNQKELKEIAFSEFKDANNNYYETKEIIGDSKLKHDNFEDLCGTTYTGSSLVEHFVILADTSETQDAASGSDIQNKLYSMHVKPLQPEKLEDEQAKKQYNALFSRTDYSEHCYGYINEIPGITYKINKETSSESSNSNTYLEAGSKITQDGKVCTHLQYDLKAISTYWDSVKTTDKVYLDVGFSLAISGNGSDTFQKIPLPNGTNIILESGGNSVTVPAASGQSTAYYYQSMRSVSGHGDSKICINDLGNNTSNQITLSFDFSNADLSSLEAYSSSDFYVVAQLVVTNDMDLPSAGDIKDTWEAKVGAEMKSDFGFALDVDDLTTLGMNQYSPEESDSGVVSYTANIAFPENNISGLESKYYTILYQVEEKTSQKGADGKPAYQPYSGDNVSLYLGKFSTTEDALSVAKSSDNSVTSGNGLVAVTYQFGTDQITGGADLPDGKTVSGNDKIAKVIKAHCTLVANCSGLDMTNYRVKAYLLVTDSLPTLTTSGNISSNESESSASTTLSGTDSSEGCLKHYWLRDGNWPTISDSVLNSDLKSDYFVFTVAKIKTSM